MITANKEVEVETLAARTDERFIRCVLCMKGAGYIYS